MKNTKEENLKNIKRGLLKFKNALLYALYPDDIKCIVCGDELPAVNRYCICGKCFKELPFYKNKPCLRCGIEMTGEGDYCIDCKGRSKSYTRAYACFNYEGSITELVHRFKYGDGQYLSRNLGLFLADKIIKKNIKFDFIIPVPLGKARLKQRGYNQAELLARVIAKEVNGSVKTDIIERVKDTPTQTHLTREERLKNLKGAFKVINKKEIKGKRFLLVDDVFTTGATSEAISEKLTKAGAAEVIVLTLAHTKKQKINNN